MNLSEKLIFDQLFDSVPNSPVLNEIYYVFDTERGFDYIFKSSDKFLEYFIKSDDRHEIQYKKTILNSSHGSFSDYRFRYLKLKDFRGITSGPNDAYLGLDFRDPKSGQIASMIILGQNGCGKTSLYNAMELTFTEDISVARKHSQDLSKANTKLEFLPYAFKDNKVFSVQIDTQNGIYEYPTATLTWGFAEYGIGFNTFFCSESDLILYEVSNSNIPEYILRQVGIKRMADLRPLLKSCISNIEAYLKQVVSVEDEAQRDENKEDVDGQTNEQENDNKNVVEASVSDENTMDEKVFSIKNIPRLQATYDDLKQIITVLDEAVDQQVNETLSEIDDNVNRLFAGVDFWDKELDERVFLNSPNTIRVNKFNRDINPRVYLNNFRFKLFIISLNVAIAFNYMRKYSICFPLVFDDVFNASDFTNRSLSVKKYIENLYKLYSDKFPNWPQLPLILFTQDEVIADAVYKGINETNAIGNNINKVMLCKMFPVKEISKETDQVITESGKEEVSFYKLYDILRFNF